MSHVSKIELEIKDLDALKQACRRLGIEFVENQQTYKWYGHLIDKDSLAEGLTEEQLGHCDHAIKVPQASLGYEVGVVRKDGSYVLLADYWDSGLKRTIGKNGGLLKQAYTAELVRNLARRNNWLYSEKQLEHQSLKLTLCAA